MAVVLSASDPLLTLLRSPSSTISVVSCSHEAAFRSSFDWSDFPIISRDSFSSSWEESSEDSSAPMSCSETRSNIFTSSIVYPSDALSSADATYTCPPPTEVVAAVGEIAATETCDTPCNSSVNKKQKKRQSVGFSSFVEVRTYGITLGDHPCCVGGLALSCDWNVQHTAVVDLDVHERYSLKRRQGSLRLSYVQRRHRLVECTGLSPSELLQLEYDQDAAVVISSSHSRAHSVSPSSVVRASTPIALSKLVQPRPLHASPTVQRLF